MDYLGKFEYSMDAKNRVFIPAKYREALKEGFVVCKAPDKCVYVYSEEEWEPVAEQVKALRPDEKISAKVLRRYKTEFFQNADNAKLDSQGRFTVNAGLVEYAGLGKKIVIAGSGNKLEIWDADRYEEEFANLPSEEEIDVEVIF